MGNCVGKSKAEGGREGEEEEEELRRLENEVMNVISAKEQREMDAVEGDAWKAASEARCSEAKMGPKLWRRQAQRLRVTSLESAKAATARYSVE